MARNIPCSLISFFNNKDIFYDFGSFLVDSGRFRSGNFHHIYNIFTSGIGGDHKWLPCSFMLVPATSRGMFLFLVQPEGLRYASSIIWGSQTLLVLNIY